MHVCVCVCVCAQVTEKRSSINESSYINLYIPLSTVYIITFISFFFLNLQSLISEGKNLKSP